MVNLVICIYGGSETKREVRWLIGRVKGKWCFLRRIRVWGGRRLDLYSTSYPPIHLICRPFDKSNDLMCERRHIADLWMFRNTTSAHRHPQASCRKTTSRSGAETSQAISKKKFASRASWSQFPSWTRRIVKTQTVRRVAPGRSSTSPCTTTELHFTWSVDA